MATKVECKPIQVKKVLFEGGDQKGGYMSRFVTRQEVMRLYDEYRGAENQRIIYIARQLGISANAVRDHIKKSVR